MKEIAINGYGLSTMCRLCLTSNETVLDIFRFSTTMRNNVADVIMTCAPVQITRSDGMPNFICRGCFIQLDKLHRFQKQILQCDKTLRRYQQQLRMSNKPIKTQCSTTVQELSEDPSIHDISPDITVKRESLENHNVKPINENSVFSFADTLKDDCNEISCEDRKPDIGDNKLEEDTNVNWKDKESRKFSADKINGEVCLKSKPLANGVFRPEYSNRCKDTQPDIGRTSVNFANLREQKSNYRVQTKFHPCAGCYEGVNALDHLNNHKFVHTDVKPCNICRNFFFRSDFFTLRKRTHTGEKLYQRYVCIRCFVRSDIFKAHKRMHTGEKPYRCEICQKCFIQSRPLNTHKRIHAGVKLYQCDVCKKCFTMPSHLNSHKRIHADENTFITVD